MTEFIKTVLRVVMLGVGALLATCAFVYFDITSDRVKAATVGAIGAAMMIYAFLK